MPTRKARNGFQATAAPSRRAYNHAILPLCNSRDKYTQIVWGVRDFEHRFGRAPEGMWLPETAVDLETLEMLVDCGIRFTILSPYQAKRTRKVRVRAWRDASGAQVDPSMPYQVKLPSGKRIAVFFYDGPISQAIAFEHLLEKGENFANRLLSAFSDARRWPQIVHIATDGETYGHHHKQGDMALAYALAPYRKQRSRETDQLRRIPRTTSAHSRSGGLGKERMELLAWGRTMEQQLWVQLRRISQLESGMAHALARGFGLAARHHRNAV